MFTGLANLRLHLSKEKVITNVTSIVDILLQFSLPGEAFYIMNPPSSSKNISIEYTLLFHYNMNLNLFS